MNSGRADARHPSLSTLALYSQADMPAIERWKLGRHLKRCSECERQIALFRAANAELKREANSETLTAFEAIADWSRLEREMLGNIAVGVAAARCIDNVGRRRSTMARVTVAVALITLLIAGWAVHDPGGQTAHLFSSMDHLFGVNHPSVSGTVVGTMPDAIAVRTQGATLMIMHPPSAVVSMSGASAVAARYVDEETGQVTIANVYGQ